MSLIGGLLVVLLMLLANGLFAMAEIALVASRRVRLEQEAAAGSVRARRALALKRQPTDFLSTVQVGITLVGILAGAYSGPRFAPPLAAQIARLPALAPYAEIIALTLIVSLLTFASLVIGELVPKAIALSAPERIAGYLAQPFAIVARLASPVVRLLSASTAALLWPLGIKPGDEQPATQEEIRALIKQATHAGELHPAEQQIVEKVFRLAERRVSSLMTPRPDIVWVDLQADRAALQEALAANHSRLLVCEGDLDRVVGVAYAKDLLGQVLGSGALDLRALLRQALFVPETLDALVLLERLRAAHTHIAVVIDEYGAVQGLVTLADLLEGVFGLLPDTLPSDEGGAVVQRADGTWLVEGSLSLDDLRHTVPLPPTPADEEGQYDTVAGLVMTRLARLPVAGDRIELEGFTIEVMDMDERRVDKVLIASHPVVPAADEAPIET